MRPGDRIVVDVERLAPTGEGDAYAGVGFFTSALLEAGFSVGSVEASPSAVADAAVNRRAWRAEDRWEIMRSDMRRFFRSRPTAVDVVVNMHHIEALLVLARSR